MGMVPGAATVAGGGGAGWPTAAGGGESAEWEPWTGLGPGMGVWAASGGMAVGSVGPGMGIWEVAGPGPGGWAGMGRGRAGLAGIGMGRAGLAGEGDGVGVGGRGKEKKGVKWGEDQVREFGRTPFASTVNSAAGSVVGDEEVGDGEEGEEGEEDEGEEVEDGEGEEEGEEDRQREDEQKGERDADDINRNIRDWSPLGRREW